MKSRPRTTCPLRSLAALALAFALLSASAWAQQQRGRTPRTSPAQNKDAERAKRAQAITLLIEMANKARLFDDLLYRARVQALAADALWPHDERQARSIFQRAWEAATASDKADQEERDRQLGTDFHLSHDLTETRNEVLLKVASRDARLAEIFLRELVGHRDAKEDVQSEQSQPNARRALNANRLALAAEMLEAREPHRAAELVTPLISESSSEAVSVELVEFIMRLRQQSVADADNLYSLLLQRAAPDPQTTATEVLLLSSPIVSPDLIVVIEYSGELQFRAIPRDATNAAAQQAVPQKIQEAFYNLAVSVLLRPRTPNDEQVTMQELVSSFYTTGRLLPFFENSSAPYAAYAPALRARHSELFNVMEASRRDQVSSQFNVSSMTPAGYVDPLRSGNEQLARAGNASERERLALSIVKTAVRNRFWDRARRAAGEIEDTDKRRTALTFIQVHQIKAISQDYGDEKEDDFESVLKFVRGADVPPFAKAWGFAQAAVIAARKREAQTFQKVAQIINEAESFAARVEQGTPERVAAYGVVVMTAARFDQQRAWNLLREYVKAANAVEDFAGDETSFDLAATGNWDDSAEHLSVEAEVFRLDGIFATMAHLDFDKALTEARALDGDVPQALATIAVAQSRLREPEPGSRNR